ncbi:hypothetical protein CL622_08110 [archaeon]|nr:hypothetical protein [archaeon]|tara:strand:+ start:99 stop:455 length:357 start_codon:yes stop_codon:yes gene_type:complete
MHTQININNVLHKFREEVANQYRRELRVSSYNRMEHGFTGETFYQLYEQRGRIATFFGRSKKSLVEITMKQTHFLESDDRAQVSFSVKLPDKKIRSKAREYLAAYGEENRIEFVLLKS